MPGEVAALFSATSATAKGRWPLSSASRSSTCLVNSSGPLHDAIQVSPATGSTLRCLSEASIPTDRFRTPSARAARSLRPTGATEVARRLVTQKPQNDLTLARHRPSLAKTQRRLTPKFWPGENWWTNHSSPGFTTCAAACNVLLKIIGHVPVRPWTLRLSQFCASPDIVSDSPRSTKRPTRSPVCAIGRLWGKANPLPANAGALMTYSPEFFILTGVAHGTT